MKKTKCTLISGSIAFGIGGIIGIIVACIKWLAESLTIVGFNWFGVGQIAGGIGFIGFGIGFLIENFGEITEFFPEFGLMDIEWTTAAIAAFVGIIVGFIIGIVVETVALIDASTVLFNWLIVEDITLVATLLGMAIGCIIGAIKEQL